MRIASRSSVIGGDLRNPVRPAALAETGDAVLQALHRMRGQGTPEAATGGGQGMAKWRGA